MTLRVVPLPVVPLAFHTTLTGTIDTYSAFIFYQHGHGHRSLHSHSMHVGRPSVSDTTPEARVRTPEPSTLRSES